MKNQDFTVGRKLYFQVSSESLFDPRKTHRIDINVAHFFCEIKTNLDKTMFQEAAATARELKVAVGDAQYILLCEWLDMPPIDTRVTEIDEVIILRRAKRLGAQTRAEFSDAENRHSLRSTYDTHISSNPLNLKSFERFIDKIRSSFPDDLTPSETEVLKRGYF